MWLLIQTDRMTTADREHAAQQLLAFLGQVGPLEAAWAMTTALEVLHEQPASMDHVATAAQAFAKAKVEACEQENAASPETAIKDVEEPPVVNAPESKKGATAKKGATDQ